MRSLLVLTITLACASAALAIACAPDQCKRMHCPMASEEACLARGAVGEFVFEPHGGFCGCCSNCVRMLKENENCGLTMILGMPPSVKCAPGLACSSATHTCVREQ